MLAHARRESQWECSQGELGERDLSFLGKGKISFGLVVKQNVVEKGDVHQLGGVLVESFLG
jgi:hypothetical protein